MELIQDWKRFDALFFGNKGGAAAAPASLKPIYIVLIGKVVLSILAENEDLAAAWVGATEDEVRAAFPGREFVVFDKAKVEGCLLEGRALNHFYEQTLHFKKSAPKEADFYGHFLLQAIQTWWKRLFPSTYGVYVQVEGTDPRSLLVVIQRGQVHAYHDPDLSFLPIERRKQPPQVVKYLAERFLMPIQGIFVTSVEWAQWSEAKNPWPLVMSAIRSNRGKLVPFKFSLVSLIASRAYLKV